MMDMNQDSDEHLLPALEDIDLRRSASELIGWMHEETRRDHGIVFHDIISAAMQVSVDMSWPAIRALAQKVRDEGPVEMRGWRFAAAPLPDPWQIGLTAERDDASGGWLYNCVIHPDLNETGLEQRKEMLASMEADGVPFGEVMVKRLRAEKDLRATRPELFTPPDECRRVRQFWVLPYIHNGGLPEIVEDKYSHADLRGTVGQTNFNENFVAGSIVSVRPAFSLAVDLKDDANPPDIPVSSTVSDAPAALEAMELLTAALRYTGISEIAEARTTSLAGTRYSFIGEKEDMLGDSVGAAAAFRSKGLVGSLVGRSCMDLWTAAIGADFTHRRDVFARMIAMLEANGHVSRETEYDCNDLNDLTYLERRDETGGVVWMRTQNGLYRIDFEDDPLTSSPRRLVLSAQHRPVGADDFDYDRDPHAPVLPSDRGFLGRLHWHDEEERFVVNYSGAFSNRTVKDVNGILGAISTVSWSLVQDYGDVADPPTP